MPLAYVTKLMYNVHRLVSSSKLLLSLRKIFNYIESTSGQYLRRGIVCIETMTILLTVGNTERTSNVSSEVFEGRNFPPLIAFHFVDYYYFWTDIKM